MVRNHHSRRIRHLAWISAAVCFFGAGIFLTPSARGEEAATAAVPLKALFSGADQKGHLNLWITNGTAAGTSELDVAHANSDGLFNTGDLSDPNLTAFGKGALFDGADSRDILVSSLWISDGTGAGTRELSTPGMALFYSGFTPEFCILGRLALFEAAPNEATLDLWTTDGTAVGTHQLNVAGVNAAGLFINGPPYFTILGTNAIFEGTDAANAENLWVTNGTAAGTSELTAANANSAGLFFDHAPNFAVLGKKALFEGSDASFRVDLWVTDGTSIGTRELTVAGAHFQGLFGSLTTPINANFGVLGDHALFMGEDTSGNINLWVTDGTSGGTTEIPVADANSGGFFASIGDPQFTVLGTSTLFVGEDNRGRADLWTTDGTAAGTQELEVARASPHGLLSGVSDPGFTVLGNKVLFAGADSRGRIGLWVTDGTSSGTDELLPAGAFAGGLQPFEITPSEGRRSFRGPTREATPAFG